MEGLLSETARFSIAESALHKLGRQTVVSGVDLVRISSIRDSLERFGDKFLKRIFTEHEAAYARSAPALCAERLATRFAAKEAVRKILRMPATTGIGWRSVELRRSPQGHCDLAFYNEVQERVQELGLGAWAVSLSHEGDYAIAQVVAAIQVSEVSKS